MPSHIFFLKLGLFSALLSWIRLTKLMPIMGKYILNEGDDVANLVTLDLDFAGFEVYYKICRLIIVIKFLVLRHVYYTSNKVKGLHYV